MVNKKTRISEKYQKMTNIHASSRTATGRHAMAQVKNKKSFTIAVQAFVLLTLIVCVLAFSFNYKTVKLIVDGEERNQPANTTSVAEVLELANFDTQNVETSHPLDSEFKDNDTIVVKTPKTVSVNVDGVDGTINTTAVTVADLPEKLGLPEEAKISVPADKKIKDFDKQADKKIEIVTPKTVTFIADNDSKVFQSTAKTVGDVLKEKNIAYGGNDRLSQDAEALLVDGMALKLSRISTQEVEEKDIEIPFETEVTKDPNMPAGERKVTQAGKPGMSGAFFKVTSIDGKEISKAVTKKGVKAEPVTEKVTVGTKKNSSDAPSSKPAETGNHPQADGLNWAALAQCEATGRVNAVDPTGLYHGLYQFDVQTWRSVGGSGLPSQASAEEQTYRAQKLYQSRGRSPWPVCGLRL